MSTVHVVATIEYHYMIHGGNIYDGERDMLAIISDGHDITIRLDNNILFK
jgi:hypothetical protein